MEDAINAAHRPPHGAAVGDLAGRPLELDLGEWFAPGAAPREQPDLVPALGERADQMRADEPLPPVTRVLPIGRDPRAPCSGCRRILIRPLRVAETAVVTDTHRLPADELRRRARDRQRQPLRLARRRAAARGRDHRLTPTSTSGCAPRERARPPRSPRSATSSPSTSRCSTTGREIVSIHISAGISGTFEAASQARQRLIDEGKGGERIRRLRLALGAPAAWASGRWSPPRPPRRARAAARRSLAAAEQAREALKMWFAIDTLEYLRRAAGSAAPAPGSARR